MLKRLAANRGVDRALTKILTGFLQRAADVNQGRSERGVQWPKCEAGPRMRLSVG